MTFHETLPTFNTHVLPTTNDEAFWLTTNNAKAIVGQLTTPKHFGDFGDFGLGEPG